MKQHQNSPFHAIDMQLLHNNHLREEAFGLTLNCNLIADVILNVTYLTSLGFETKLNITLVLQIVLAS